jgi:phosphate transport system substrate-binding protein
MEKLFNHIRIIVGGILLTAGISSGCSEPDETSTKGYLAVSSADVAFRYIDQAAIKFQSTYNQAYIDVQRTTSREALVNLTNGKSRLAVMAREPNALELETLESREELFVSRTVAHDAIAVIVHGDNPIEELTIGQLKDVFTGEVTNWRELGGKNKRIRPLVRDRNSGTYEVFQEDVLQKAKFGANAYPCSTMTLLTRLVEAEPGAIGLTGLLMTKRGYIKTIKIGETEDGPYYLPTQEKVYRKLYPLYRPLVLCYFKESARMVNLVSGYVTYLTAVKGQQLAINEGLVPATMPVRTVKVTN